jgi:hypothetical protein
MAVDYIVFVHGVKTRNPDTFSQTALKMFAQMEPYLQTTSSRKFKPIILFWGDIAEKSTNIILNALQDSPTWKQFWFQKFRTEQVIPFVGDAALYLSRHVSVQIIKQMTAQALAQMGLKLDEIQQKSKQDGDRLHLVTHSWGTVILFDIMFATRWEDVSLEPEIIEFVNTLRSCFFGVGNPEITNLGIPIASIHTMGSPISLFNLLNASGAKSFNLTPELKKFLSSLYDRTGKPLPWFNYTHPGDPIAYPLKGVMDISLDNAKEFVMLEDIIAPTNSWLQFFNQNIISIIQGGEAHNSYWTNELVSTKIGQVIQSC